MSQRGTNAPHGTRSRYQGTTTVPGCRCEACRAANAEYRQQRPRPDRMPGVDSLGQLAVACWCEQQIVWRPPQDVKAGRTGSCGRPGCQPPGQDAA